MRPRKSLGQNFLQDAAVINRIVNSLSLSSDDAVVEIGPGTGALTNELLQTAASVIAIEFDRDLIPILNKRFGGHANFTLLNRDALDVDLAEVIAPDLGPAKSKLVANLPYNISAPILQRLIAQRHLFSDIVLMFQREVVHRITAKAGGKDRGYLSVLVEDAFETEYLFDVPPDAFLPVPKVWSAVVRLTPIPSAVTNDKLFRQVVSASFAQKRKTISNNLKNRFAEPIAALSDAGIDGKRRAETLTLDEWTRLTDTISKHQKPDDLK